MACIDLRGIEESPNVRDGFVIQDGAIPEALGPVIQAMLENRISMRSYNSQSLSNAIARMKSWLLGPYYAGGSVNRTAVYLIMSHDENEGTMEQSEGDMTLQWSGIGANLRKNHINSLLEGASASFKATLVMAPSITVHPLGGACMSHDNTGLGGVVNHVGQMFSGSGNHVHEGIICVDASTIPTSLGKKDITRLYAI